MRRVLWIALLIPGSTSHPREAMPNTTNLDLIILVCVLGALYAWAYWEQTREDGL